ncbi:ATP-dependent RNA helicase SUPV3L1/SUV3 [Blastomonas natatoria]|uniref:ATP-dependent RNA helicase SUPV3L1/SUV3 n=1 Tax=Blastomonas natatoria TaxID=34015 RepID=A0A2V3VB88_9SPHN|nr:helicase-related protein [Blastomonas natatoria]PXW78018.1 ATP-dependent RNA helicase SUPV3L1/SUV3 [Blastomonas natatoria]
MTRFSPSSVTAVLGPTNTGKTHLAIERMCAHSSGLIGFPLRLLAREVYDRVVRIKGPNEVALVTGEERIVPPGARWFLSTAESMPLDQGRDFAFVAIDEAQLGAHPERGHVFTDRMLNARGRDETMILGSEAMAPMIRALVPDAEIIGRPRFSTLSYAGIKKLSRLPPRSAIVAFSAEEVYAVAEMLRRFRGGAAVVMGALSPATRNAQVAMYQAGEVDYLVATDAIGMGLNMDVDHVAFASLHKYDGARRRRLTLSEMAQIAGRAGRHQRDGTFGSVAGHHDAQFTDEEIERIEQHSFPPLKSLFWRESRLRFDSLGTLIADLERLPSSPVLQPAPEAIDLAVLRRLADDPHVAASVRGQAAVRRFWSVCSLPDFQHRGAEHHASFVGQLWQHLGHGLGHIPVDFIARKIADLDSVQGDVEKLGARIAAIRTWAYVAQRRDWLADPAEMAGRAREVEERLSDALHRALAQRFVDRRTAVLLRGLGGDASLLPVTLEEGDAICVDGEPIGHLNGFAFVVDAQARLADRKLLVAAADRHLPGLLARRARDLIADGAKALSIGGDDKARPALFWRGQRIGLLVRGASLAEPRFQPDRALDAIPRSDHEALLAHVADWLQAHLRKPLSPVRALTKAAEDKRCPGPLRALLVQLVEAGGAIARTEVDPLLAAIDGPARQVLQRLGVRLGSLDIFCAAMIRPDCQRLLVLMRAVRNGEPVPAHAVLASLQTVVPASAVPPGGHPAYRMLGNQALRVDMAEKLIRAAHDGRGDAPSFAIDPALAISMGLSAANAERLMRAAGFRREGGKSDADPDMDKLWRWRGLARKKKQAEAAGPADMGHFAALKEWKVAIG